MATVEDNSEKKSGEAFRPMVEDLIVIWFDPSMEEMENQGDVQKTKSLLRQINCYVVFFANTKLCWDYIRSISKETLISHYIWFVRERSPRRTRETETSRFDIHLLRPAEQISSVERKVS